MKTEISQDQIASYQEQGFLIIEDFLNASELEFWREAVGEAVADRVDQATLSQSSGTEDTYYQNVFVQCSNLWKTHESMRKLVLDPQLGKMTALLAGVDGQRVYHDHAMVKRPSSNPTNWHMDNPFDPFFHRDALSTWLALDDATVANGCLYYLPGVHKKADYSFTDALLSVPNMGTLFKVFSEWSNRTGACRAAGRWPGDSQRPDTPCGLSEYDLRLATCFQHPLHARRCDLQRARQRCHRRGLFETDCRGGCHP